MSKRIEILLDNAQSGGAKLSVVTEGEIKITQSVYLGDRENPEWVDEYPGEDGIRLLSGTLVGEK